MSLDEMVNSGQRKQDEYAQLHGQLGFEFTRIVEGVA